MRKTILIAGIASLLMLSCSKDKKTDTSTVTTVDKEQIKTDIQALENAYQESMNAKNTDGIKDFYAEDARTYVYGKPVGLGKAAILESIQKDFANAAAGAQIHFSIKELLVSNDGNQVVEISGFSITDKTGAAAVTGHYFGLFEKREGRYQCVREMITPDTALKQK